MAVVQADRRETFYEAQRRHRRAGWRFSLLSVMAVFLLGLPVSVLISPFIAAVGLISVDVANEWTPMPDPVGELGELFESTSDTGQAAEEPVTVPGTTLLAIGRGLPVPGLVTMGLIWLCVRRLMLRSGAAPWRWRPGPGPERRPGGAPARQPGGGDGAGRGCPRRGDGRRLSRRQRRGGRPLRPRRHDHRAPGLLDQLGHSRRRHIADMLAVVVNGDQVALVSSALQTFDVVGAMLPPLGRRTQGAVADGRSPRAGPGDGARTFRRRADRRAMMGADDSKPHGCLVLLQVPFLVAAGGQPHLHDRGGMLVAPIMGPWRRPAPARRRHRRS
jgi:hypothetical protein